MKQDPSLEAYLRDARSWELDRAQQAGRSARVAWWVAGGASLMALVCAGALAALAPLKRTVPYLVRVDNGTGIVDVVPAYKGDADIPEIVTRTLLNGYVMSRERYFYGTAEADFELVAAQSSPQLGQDWSAAWDRANPASPLNAYKDGSTVRAQVRSITFLRLPSGRTNVAQVRFSRYLRAGGTGDEQATHWLATVEYAYVPPATDERARSLNPIGFRVIEYRKEPEVLAHVVPARTAP